jgi:capsular polysaccharide biosynthesis protein
MHVERASLMATTAGSSWFGHWLMDEVPMQMLAARYAPGIAHPRPLYSHEPAYLQALQLAAPLRPASARIDQLIVVDEFAQNPHKTLRYQHARARLRAEAPAPDGRRVFLKRGTEGQARRIANEEALAERLAREGFEVQEIGRARFDDLRQALLGADVMVSVEGSHLDHALFMMPTTASLIILNPPARFMTTVADMAIFCGIDCGIFCCQATDGAGQVYEADPDEVLHFIDQTMATVRARAGRVRDFVSDVLALVPDAQREQWNINGQSDFRVQGAASVPSNT